MTERREPYLTAKGQRRCADRNKAGRPCESFALRGSDRCFAHDRGSGPARREALRAGGRASRRARQGKSVGAVIAALYGSAEGLGPGFPLAPDDEVRRPMAVLALDPERMTKCLLDGDGRPLIDDPWECAEHVACLRQKALALVGLRPDGSAYRLGERYVPAATVEDWLGLVVPDRDGTRPRPRVRGGAAPGEGLTR